MSRPKASEYNRVKIQRLFLTLYDSAIVVSRTNLTARIRMSENLQISLRGIEMPESPIRKLAPLAYAAQDRGMKIYRLNIGQPDLPTPPKALEVLKHIGRTTLEYSPSQG